MPLTSTAECTLALLLLSFLLILSASLNWTKSANTIPPLHGAYQMSLGYYSGSIWFLGGAQNQLEQIEYNIVNETYTAYPLNVIDFGHVLSQNWYQINDTVYISPDDGFFDIFGYNLVTKTQTATITGYDSDTYAQCITIFNDQFLFVIGGAASGFSPVYNYFRIYDMINNQWMNGTSIPEPRTYFSCITHNNLLYGVAGYTRSNAYGATGTITPLNSVITMNVTNLIAANLTALSWSILNDTLTSAKYGHRIILHHDFIYVVGGWDGTSYVDEVDVIDTLTHSIWLDSRLVSSKGYLGLIIAQNVLYAFAGTPSPNTEYYQYAMLPTFNPTVSPTAIPTSNTFNPSTSLPTTSPIIATAPSDDNAILFYILFGFCGLIVILLICLLVCFGCFWRKRKRKNENNDDKRNEKKQVEMHHGYEEGTKINQNEGILNTQNEGDNGNDIDDIDDIGNFYFVQETLQNALQKLNSGSNANTNVTEPGNDGNNADSNDNSPIDIDIVDIINQTETTKD